MAWSASTSLSFFLGITESIVRKTAWLNGCVVGTFLTFITYLTYNTFRMPKPFRECVSVVLLRPVQVCEPRKEPSAPRGTPGGTCSVLYEVLLVHKPRKHDDWQLPQGGIEKGETIEHAARREIREETGISIEESAIFFKSLRIYAYDYPKGYARALRPPYRGQRIQFVGVPVPPDTTVRVDGKEVDGHIWALPEDIQRYVKRKEYLKVIQRVIAESLEKGKTA